MPSRHRRTHRPLPGAPKVPAASGRWELRNVPTRWLLAFLRETSLVGPARVRGTAAELLQRLTPRQGSGLRALEARGQLQLAGVLGPRAYPAAPRWRPRARAVA